LGFSCPLVPASCCCPALYLSVLQRADIFTTGAVRTLVFAVAVRCPPLFVAAASFCVLLGFETFIRTGTVPRKRLLAYLPLCCRRVLSAFLPIRASRRPFKPVLCHESGCWRFRPSLLSPGRVLLSALYSTGLRRADRTLIRCCGVKPYSVMPCRLLAGVVVAVCDSRSSSS